MRPTSLSLFRCSASMSLHHGYVRRGNNPGVYDHHVHVLHSWRTSQTNWLLVWDLFVSPPEIAGCTLNWQTRNKSLSMVWPSLFWVSWLLVFCTSRLQDSVHGNGESLGGPALPSLTSNAGWWSLRAFWPLLLQLSSGEFNHDYQNFASLNGLARLFFPDSLTTAKFLTPEERVLAVGRIKANQAGAENKHWKREQCVTNAWYPMLVYSCLRLGSWKLWRTRKLGWWWFSRP